MDLTTQYMGLKLKNPLIAAASPLSYHLDNYKEMEDAGIAAIVNGSIFEEQITREALNVHQFSLQGTHSFAEALTFTPEQSIYTLGPEEYLEHIRAAKKTVDIPVIASLNGHTVGGWTSYAKQIQEAGADALELNIYFLATDMDKTSSHVENTYVEILKAVKSAVTIPVAVKIAPYFSSMAHMAKRLEESGADALVLFNRFYQPDIDLEALEVAPNLLLSTSYEMRLPLRWIAILYGKLHLSLAATSGIHYARDVLKMLMAGADVTMLCSVLLEEGIGYAAVILKQMEEWMETHAYESVQQMKGSMSQQSCENPQAFERANYMRVLRSFRSG
jgi:dihydroorotate dehydrogenase (fumarate)